MRAYLRIDPEVTDKKEAAGYPDGAVAAFLSLLCAGEQQPQRGRFKTLAILKAFLGKRARWIPFLFERKDLVTLESGLLYIDGWDEWQEGDWTVKERVQRVRNRQHVTVGETPPVTVPVTPDVTVDVTVPTVNTPQLDAIAVSGKRLAVGVSVSNQEEHLELKHVLSAEGRRDRDEVFEAWKDSTDHPRARLDTKRARVIDQALKAYPKADVIDAVHGWRHSPHHRGENDQRTVYNDIELLLRDAKQIERFRDLERDGPTGSTFLRLASVAESLGQ